MLASHPVQPGSTPRRQAQQDRQRKAPPLLVALAAATCLLGAISGDVATAAPAPPRRECPRAGDSRLNRSI